MSLMKSLYVAPTFLSLLFLSSLSTAQTEINGATQATAKPAPAYGDNPNIFEVLAHKTSDKVVNTAEKVGDATERGVAKIKPKVDQAWDNITAKHTTDVPIEQKPLNRSSNNEVVPKISQTPAATVSTAIDAIPSQTQQIAQPQAQTPVTPAGSNKTSEIPVEPVKDKVPEKSVAPSTQDPATPTPQVKPTASSLKELNSSTHPTLLL